MLFGMSEQTLQGNDCHCIAKHQRNETKKHMGREASHHHQQQAQNIGLCLERQWNQNSEQPLSV